MKSLPLPTSYETAIKVMCVANEHLILNELGFTDIESFQTETVGSNSYDVVHINQNENKLKLYFDITGFYGKSDELILGRKDYPLPQFEYNLIDFFDFEFLKSNKFVKDTKLKLKLWASNTHSQLVMVITGDNIISSTLVREYVNIEGVEVSILHGFIPLKLIAIHYLSHIETNHDSETTEVPVQDTTSMPNIGVDCVKFTPLEPYGFLNDYLNTIFYTHKPDALLNSSELLALCESLAYGVMYGYFTVEEIEKALTNAGIDKTIRTKIVNTIKEETTDL